MTPQADLIWPVPLGPLRAVARRRGAGARGCAVQDAEGFIRLIRTIGEGFSSLGRSSKMLS